MIKRKKSNLTPNKSEVDIPKSSIGFGAFEFFKNIARKYGIFRKPCSLPALIFLRLTGKRAEIKSVKPDSVISASNYFTFHLSFYFKIIRQLIKFPGIRYQPYPNSIYGREQLKHLASDRILVLYSMKDKGSVNFDPEPFLQERSLIFLKMPGISNELVSVQKLLKAHDSPRKAFSGSTTRTFLRETDFIYQLNYLNSFRQIIPNTGTSSYERSGILPLAGTGSDEDIFQMNTPVGRGAARFSQVTYPAHRSIMLDTENFHLSHYMYHWNISREPTAGYLPFQRPLNRDTIITLNPQNTAVSFLWRNFNIGGSTTQRTAPAPAERKKKKWQHTEFPHINVHNVVNTDFPRLVGFSSLKKERVKDTYLGSFAGEAAVANSFSLVSYPVYRAIKEPEPQALATKELSIRNRKDFTGTGLLSRLVSRQTNLTLEHQNTAVGYLTKNESSSGSSLSGQALDNQSRNIVSQMWEDNSILIHNRTIRNILYKNNSVTDETIQRRTLVNGIGGEVNYISALQDRRQTPDQKKQPYLVTVSGTKGFTMDGAANISLSHTKARQVNEVQKPFEVPFVHPGRTISAGKTSPEYSIFEDNSGVSWNQGTLPIQHNTTLQNRNLSTIRNILVGWKNSNLTMSARKSSMTVIPVNPVPENIYLKEGVNPHNSAELILKKNAVQSTVPGAGNKENIQSERTATTKTNDTLNKDSFKQRPAQELNIIAERVYKIIERKLSIEKDRRGLS